MELLKEAVPRATGMAVLLPDDPKLRPQVQEIEKAAASLGVTLIPVEVRGGDYEWAFASAAACPISTGAWRPTLTAS
jgi:ABC-type uncharacterized transport system substrate-binding protein